MANPTFSYVEEYIEFIAGYIDINGFVYSIFDTILPVISLSRNDNRIIESLSHQTLNLELAYTDRQAELAKKLIVKYRRQLESMSIIVPDVLDNYRMGIRQIDRTKKAWIENDKIILKFPFDVKLIDLIKKEQQISQGQITFKPETKTWELSITEYAINFIIACSEIHSFDVSDDIKMLFHKILEVEKSNYKIELLDDSSGIDVINADKNLLEYLQNTVGSFNEANILGLIDQSSVLGYTVDESIIEKQLSECSTLTRDLILKRRIHVESSTEIIDAILDYARKFKRTPVYCYTKLITLNEVSDLVMLNNKSSLNIQPKLLITDSEFMIGSKRQTWLMNSEKVVVLK